MSQQTILVGIVGLSCSGKSTLAKSLYKYYQPDSSHLDLDDLIVMGAEFNCQNPNSTEIDNFQRIYQGLVSIKNGQLAHIRSYNCHTKEEGKIYNIKPAKLIVVEGHLSMWFEQLKKLYDLKIFVDTPETICFQRRVDRTYGNVHVMEIALESSLKRWKLISKQWNEHLLASTTEVDLKITPSDNALDKTIKKIQNMQLLLN